MLAYPPPRSDNSTYDPDVPYSILSHTADTGLAATAPSLSELIGDLADGMFALMASALPAEPRSSVEIHVVASSVEDLVIDVLSELLYRSEVDDVIFTDFSVEVGRGLDTRIVAQAVDLASSEPTGPPIKAVTYHDLSVVETNDGWEAVVYFDV
jgi:SHS2 domain-containing protein